MCLEPLYLGEKRNYDSPKRPEILVQRYSVTSHRTWICTLFHITWTHTSKLVERQADWLVRTKMFGNSKIYRSRMVGAL